MFAGTRYLGEWQTRVTRMANQLAATGAALFVTDILQIATAGRTVQSNTSVLDALRPFVESGRVLLVAEATPETLRAMQRVPSFASGSSPRVTHPMRPDAGPWSPFALGRVSHGSKT